MVVIRIDEVLAEGDMVAVRGIFGGTNSGPMMGIPPTGKTCRVPFIAMGKVVDGKFVERWLNFDEMSMMRQLGLMPGM